ncbi:hypothetical protein [Prolixibacter sp. SD074]|jgi:hypothetical protein|uniref:hypothetical protein n=1 Tax=Prolixibacter sp. SD074 TaxID=2652391 RepID=UPI00127C6CE4|nr:hypothetical protein [Prolixibacter sp. SD074]GET30283.1 hypothetical protein SD074_24850 [Prolixibacter sp. SD074]
MNPNGGFTGILNTEHGTLKIKLSLIRFEEDGVNIIYCPAVEVYGYGNNNEEAEASFRVSLAEFFNYTLHKGTFESELKRMGWYIPRHKRQKMIPPSMSYLLENNENFNRIFNEHNYSKTDEIIDLPMAV